jgi:hypothetical protein
MIKFVIDTGELNHQIIFIKAPLTSAFILYSPIGSCDLKNQKALNPTLIFSTRESWPMTFLHHQVHYS